MCLCACSVCPTPGLLLLLEPIDDCLHGSAAVPAAGDALLSGAPHPSLSLCCSAPELGTTPGWSPPTGMIWFGDCCASFSACVLRTSGFSSLCLMKCLNRVTHGLGWLGQEERPAWWCDNSVCTAAAHRRRSFMKMPICVPRGWCPEALHACTTSCLCCPGQVLVKVVAGLNDIVRSIPDGHYKAELPLRSAWKARGCDGGSIERERGRRSVKVATGVAGAYAVAGGGPVLQLVVLLAGATPGRAWLPCRRA